MNFFRVTIMRVASYSALTLLIGALGSQALAQDDDDEEALEEIVVTGSLKAMPTQDVGSVFGFDKTILETSRSVSTISSEQIDRFDMDDIDELITLAPGTFTQSFFGVAGSLDVRGTPGETYFRGVKRLDNPGNYPTPIGASDRIDIVRGPASPIYGPAKIGGYLNFVPKSARVAGGQYLDQPEGKLSYTTGSWDKSVLSAEVGGPGRVGSKDFGYYVYGMLENSGSYYNNSSVDQTLIQMSFDADVNDKLSMQFGGMFHDFAGNQIAGWNRLTQELVDNGTYLTGIAQDFDTDGDGRISHQEYRDTDYFDADDNFVTIAPFIFRPEFVTEDQLSPFASLENTGSGTIQGNQVLVAPEDVLENEVTTIYFDLIYQADNGWETKNQFFFETYDSLSENAYGFSQFHEAWVIEDKIVISKAIETGSLTTSMQISPSIRHTDFEHGDDFTNEFFDRRDLTGPSTARDKRVLSTQSGADYSEYDIGNYTDLGIAFMLDMTWESGLNILVGARYDTIDMESHLPIDKLLLFNFTTGFVIPSGDGLYMLNDFVDPDNYEQSDIQAPFDASDTVDGVSWTASVSWALPGGFVPYATASEQSTIIAGQGANISTGLIWSEGAFDTSTLWEVGIKGSFLDDTLYMALSVYEQERTDFNVQAIVTNSTNRTEGLEFETRWAPIDNLILTIGYSNMKVLNLNTLENGGRFSFYGADDMPQIDPALVYGGQVIGVPAATNESQAARAGVPENIFTFTGTYMLDSGLAFNASIVSAEEVFSGYSQAVKLPSYTLFNLGLVYETDNWMFSITGKNLSDERYFRANFPNLFGSQIVLPELPRHYQATASFRF